MMAQVTRAAWQVRADSGVVSVIKLEANVQCELASAWRFDTADTATVLV